MTLRELSQYYYLTKEIKGLEADIERLALKAQPGAQVLTGLPRAPGVTDRVAHYAAAMTDIQRSIESRLERSLTERAKLEAYISGIDDSFMRQIISLRFVEGLSWSQVARRVGGGNTAHSVSMACYRYLDQH